ncbi:MAG: histidine phosphatase family protein [Spirochaetia bacterium]|jgi:broad specificity phosphatase PhoE
MSENRTRIILVRHGQTDWNVNERFRGHTDVPLNDVGVRQAELTARRIEAEWKPTAIYSSPLSRALDTAKAIARPFSLAVEILPALIDMSFGEWEGLSPREVKARWPELLSAWYTTPQTVKMPGGESLDEVRRRCVTALAEISSRHAGETVVAVAHTDVNRTMLLVVLGLGNDRLWHLKQDNCAVSEIEIDGNDFSLASMNETCHVKSQPRL